MTDTNIRIHLPGYKGKLQSIFMRNPILWYLVRHLLVKYLYRFFYEVEYEILKYLDIGDGEIIDIGANDGISAMQFRMFNKTNKIISIEPNPVYIHKLNKIKNRINNFEYINTALSLTSGTFILYIPYYYGISCATCASMDWENVQISLKNTYTVKLETFKYKIVKVKTKRLDDLKLNPSFIKIDVEGLEYEVLKGSMNTINLLKPILLIEHHNEEISKKVDKLLKNNDYIKFGFDPKKKKLYRRESNDDQNNIYLHNNSLEMHNVNGVSLS